MHCEATKADIESEISLRKQTEANKHQNSAKQMNAQ